MKTLLAFGAIVTLAAIVVFASVGALRIFDTGDEVQITIDKEEIKETTEQAVDKTKDLGERAAESTREFFSPSDADDVESPSDPQASPRTTDSSDTSEDYRTPSEKEQETELR
jgi:hypothetical protein